MSLNTQTMIQNIAKDFNLSYELFIQESARLFLGKKLKEIKSQIYEIACRYGISSIDDFEDLYKQGKIEELATFNDYKTFDRLEFQKDKIEKLLDEII